MAMAAAADDVLSGIQSTNEGRKYADAEEWMMI